MRQGNLLSRAAAYFFALALVLTLAGSVDARNDDAQRPQLEIDLLDEVHDETDAEGFGFATYEGGGCPPLSDDIEIAGSGSDGTWTFTYSVVSNCDGWTWTDTVSGPWDPAVGGCFALLGFYQLCLQNPVEVLPGQLVVYDYSNTWDLNSGYVVLQFS